MSSTSKAATPSPSARSSAYTLGHQSSVIRSHISRTAENSAAFLLPHIQPQHHILDLGCGPGTITASFVSYVPHGSVTGVDLSPSVISTAISLATSSTPNKALPPNLYFRTVDLTSPPFPFPSASFDIIYTSQTLLHIPVSAIPNLFAEIHRLLRPPSTPDAMDGGFFAAREADSSTFIWNPDPTGNLELWGHTLGASLASAGAEPRACRAMGGWAAAAGFTYAKMRRSCGATCYSSPEERKWWAGLHRERLAAEEGSDQRRTFLQVPGVGEAEVGAMREAMREWETEGDGWFGMMSGEILCWK